MSATYNDTRSVERVETVLPSRPRVSWSALFAGVVLVVALEVLFSVLGTAIGLGLVSPNTGTTPDAYSFGAGAGIWWLGSTIVALIVGGYTAARLAGVGSRFDGALHGLVIWGLALLMTVYLISSAVGGLVGGTFSVMGGTLSAAGSAVNSAAGAGGNGLKAMLPRIQQATGINPDILQQQAESIFQAPTPADPNAMSRPDAVKAVGEAMPDLMANNDKSAAAKQRITEIVAAQAHISPEDAQKRVDDAQARFAATKDQVSQTARQAADKTAATASQASFLAFAGLLAGAIAAAIGGAMALPRHAVVTSTGHASQAAGRLR